MISIEQLIARLRELSEENLHVAVRVGVGGVCYEVHGLEMVEYRPHGAPRGHEDHLRSYVLLQTGRRFLESRACARCGAIFQPVNHSQLFCSKTCKRQEDYLRYADRRSQR